MMQPMNTDISTKPHQSHILISSMGNTLSLHLNETRTFTFDWAGRPLMMMTDGRCYVRGLDGRVKEKSWKGSRDLFDRTITDLSETETKELYRHLYHDIKTTLEHVQSGKQYELRVANHQEIDGLSTAHDILTRLSSWSPDLLFADEKAFQKTYQPINILPPDQYLSVIIQAVDGCPWNKCSFCTFYEGRKFRIKPLNEIIQHITDIKEFLGQSLKLRRAIFLSDANALVMATRDLLPLLDAVRFHFPEQTNSERGGIYTFGDVPAILGKTVDELVALRQVGLRRVYIGMESGSDVVRQRIRKPAQKKDLVRAAQALKTAGLEVGLIVLLGVGGKEFEESHVANSVSAIQQMALSRGDIIYFSPYYPEHDSLYFNRSEPLQLTTLTKDDLRRQYQVFIEKLGFSRDRSHPITAVYDIREFVI